MPMEAGLRADQKISDVFAQVLHDALDRPIAFHRVFVKLTGSVTAALMLSQAMYWSKRANSDDESWFYKTIEQWEEETGLTRREQEFARKALRRFSFWKEDLRGVPARMHYHVDIMALSNELLYLSESKASKEKPNKITRLHENAKLVCTKASNKIVGNVQTSMAETAKHYKGVSEITTETTTTPLTPLQAESGDDSVVDELSDESGRRRELVTKTLAATILSAADPACVVRAAERYGRSDDDVSVTIDVLDLQYRKSRRPVEDPTGLVIAALKDGVTIPEGYVPRAQREAEAEQKRETAKKRADEERRAKKAEDNAYREAEAKLIALPEKKREEMLAKAKSNLPAGLRNSQMAVKTEAIRMMIADARAPD